MDIQEYELHERIERVEAAEASENDLLTVAIPPEKAVVEALERVEEDRAEAERAFLGDHLDHRLEDAIVGGTFSVEYATEQGLRQLAEKASEQIRDAEREEMRETLDRFFDALHVDSGGESGSDSDADDTEVVYGREKVEEALDYDAVETVLVSEDLSPEAVEEIQERAENEGGECIVVPTDFARGEQFSEGFDGVAAILRFPIE